MRVFVYFNLARKCWSIKALSGKHKGRVIGHASSVLLALVKFKVNEKGRQRVLQEKRKNVHAGAVGRLQCATLLAAPKAIADRYRSVPVPDMTSQVRFTRAKKIGTLVSYNPYKAGFFYAAANGERVDCASMVAMSPKGVVHAKTTAQYTNSELATNLATV